LVFLFGVLLLGLLAFLFAVVLALLRRSLLLRLIFLVVLELARVFFFVPHVHLVLLAVVVVLGLFRPFMA